ncbi:nuclear transport factor 2 family protein [Pseudomonas sp. App30]|uniref:nuclear transport factor 2 family protein n=1 Tax=Pseudomonas sp. App30 TaxID=3068990 RepID=UPI003A7F6BC9
MSEHAIIDTINELEALRCRALVANDLDGLAELLDEQLVHVHATGQVDGKQQYLQLVRGAIRFLKVERKALQVRVLGDVAVASGRLLQHIEFRSSGERRAMDVMTTQVWAREAAGWRLVSFQATNL